MLYDTLTRPESICALRGSESHSCSVDWHTLASKRSGTIKRSTNLTSRTERPRSQHEWVRSWLLMSSQLQRSHWNDILCELFKACVRISTAVEDECERNWPDIHSNLLFYFIFILRLNIYIYKLKHSIKKTQRRKKQNESINPHSKDLLLDWHIHIIHESKQRWHHAHTQHKWISVLATPK